MSGVEIDRIDHDTIYFKADSGPVPKPLKLSFFDAISIGAIRPDGGGLPYFLLTGKACQNCPNERSIYIVRPNANQVALPAESYVYPGKIFDHRTRALVVESRAFYGHCLPKKGEVFIIFQKELIDRRRRMGGSLLVAEPGEQHLEERLIERHLPSINPTLRLVRAKSCHEIEGKNRIGAPVSLGKPSEKLPTDDRDDGDDDTNDDEEVSAPQLEASPAPTATSSPHA